MDEFKIIEIPEETPKKLKSKSEEYDWFKERCEFVRELKSKPCMDCGLKFPSCCMDFDHRDPSEKVGTISELMGHGFHRLMAEIEKCDLVCANCHRVREEFRRVNGRILSTRETRLEQLNLLRMKRRFDLEINKERRELDRLTRIARRAAEAVEQLRVKNSL